MQNVCPSVRSSVRLFLNAFSHFHPIGLGKVPKDAEFSEVVHSTFRYRNFILIFRESAEHRFPWKFRKFKFFHYNQFYDCFRGKKGPRILSFPDIRNYPSTGIYRILTGKFREKFFFQHFCQFGCNVADSEFCGFCLIPIMIFRITAKIPNLPGNSGRSFVPAFL